MSARRSRVRLRQLARLRRRVPQLPPPHRLRGDRRGRRRHAARLLVHGGARAGGPRGRRGRRPPGRRAHRAPAGCAPARDAASARCCSRPPRRATCSAFSSARSPAARCTASRRSCSIRWGKQVFAPHLSIREEPHLPRGRASTPFDNEGVATAPRDVVAGRRRDGLLPRQLLGAQARHGHDRQRRRQPQPGRLARRRRPAGAAATDGSRAAGHRAAGAGRQPGDRRFLARRRRLLDRGRRRSPSRSRRSPSPATSTTCSATSSRSATTSTGAAAATPVPSSSVG